MARSKKERADSAVDRYLATRICDIRNALGVSQEQLGRMIGVSAQQVYKYEKGISSISAGALYAISQGLGISIEYLFEGIQQKCRSYDRIINVVGIHDRRYIKALHHLTRVLAEHLTRVLAEH